MAQDVTERRLDGEGYVYPDRGVNQNKRTPHPAGLQKTKGMSILVERL
jgi:hypothetical protein